MTPSSAAREEARQAAEARAAAQAQEVVSADTDAAVGSEAEPPGAPPVAQPLTTEGTASPESQSARAESEGAAEEAGTRDEIPHIAVAEPSSEAHGDADVLTGAADDTDRATSDVGGPPTPETDDATTAIVTPRSSDATSADHAAAPVVLPETTLTSAEPARSPVDASRASGSEARGGEDSASDDGSPDRLGAQPADAASATVSRGAPIELPGPLHALLVAAARARRLSDRDALAEAVLAYALAALGTRDVHALLDIALTWKRADGLYALTPDRSWQKLTG